MYVTADKSFTRPEKIAGISVRNTTTEEGCSRFESTVYIRSSGDEAEIQIR